MYVTNADELNRLIRCNGSRLMGVDENKSTPIDDLMNPSRTEGIAAHWLSTVVFNHEYAECIELVDRKAPNGVYITPEMVEHVDQYLKDIKHDQFMFQAMEVVTTIKRENYTINARADHIAFDAQARLWIDDFKYGYGIVEPEMNWTLIAHAIGFVLGNPGFVPKEIIFRIHQPRPHHPEGKLREWPISYAQLLELYNQLNDTMNNLNSELHTGPYCPKCPGFTNCPAARKNYLNALDAMEEIAFKDDLSNDVLASELELITRAKEIIEHRYDAYKELAVHRLKQGQIIKNFHVEDQLGNTTWIKGLDADFLKALFGQDLSAPKLITPTQAKKKVPEEYLKPFTYRPITGLKLVRMDADKRAKKLLNKKG